MPMMDLKSKSVSWFGNVFQKFESMCHEVDNIVSQETVKCVGNQVQSIGESMKRLYADVVQDDPLPLDPSDCEGVSGDMPKNAGLGTTNFVCETSSGNLNEDLPATSPVNCREFQSLQEACENKNAHEDPVMGEDKNDIMSESSAEVLELSTSDGRESLEVSFLSEPIECDCENATALMDKDSPEKSVRCEELQPLQKAGRVCNGPLDDFDHVSECPNSDYMSEMAFSVTSCDERSKGMDFPSSTSHIMSEMAFSAELYRPLHNSYGSIPIENFTYDNSATDLSSTASLPSESFMSRAGKEPASPYRTMSFESIGLSNSGSYMTDDLNGAEMENIDLSDQTKLENCCVFVDDNMLHEVSRRTRKLRSYKKKIQDVFAPKKMLAKEYERLAIWYGDCDMGSSQDMVTTRSLSTATFAGENMQIQQIHDSEWELL